MRHPPTLFDPGFDCGIVFFFPMACLLCLVPKCQISFATSPSMINTGEEHGLFNEARRDAHTFLTISSLRPFLLALGDERWHPLLFLCWRGYNRLHYHHMEDLWLLPGIAWYLNFIIILELVFTGPDSCGFEFSCPSVVAPNMLIIH